MKLPGPFAAGIKKQSMTEETRSFEYFELIGDLITAALKNTLIVSRVQCPLLSAGGIFCGPGSEPAAEFVPANRASRLSSADAFRTD